MRTTRLSLRVAALALGAMLVGSAAAAFAQDQYGEEGVDIHVEIDAVGELALTVDDDSVALVEDGSTDTVRQFTGQLPTVTVTDTRDESQIEDGAFWYVLGSATDFAGDAGQDDIGAGHLGWEPELIDGGDSGLVVEGDPVDTVLDDPPNNVGLVDQELLAMAIDSQAVNPEGQWTATADLFLRTPSSVSPGSYSSVLTLSLFE